MANELSPLASVQQQIQDRIKSEFVSLIPELMWENMVQSVITEFVNGPKNQYGSTTEAPMKAIIKEAVAKFARDAVDDEMKKLSSTHWDGFGKQVVSEALRELIAKDYDAILAGMQKQMVDMAVMNGLNNIRGMMR